MKICHPYTLNIWFFHFELKKIVLAFFDKDNIHAYLYFQYFQFLLFHPNSHQMLVRVGKQNF
jgi:hypothetical protein